MIGNLPTLAAVATAIVLMPMVLGNIFAALPRRVSIRVRTTEHREG